MNEKNTSSKTGMVAQAAVYTAAIGAGVASMWAVVRDNFYNGIKNSTWLKALRNQRNKAFEDIAGKTGTEYAQAHIKIAADYSKNVTEKLKEKGFTNSWEKFKFLTKHQQIRVIGIAVTVAMVTMGAVTALRQSARLEKLLKDSERVKETESAVSR